MKVNFVARTHKGKRRKTNEDAYYAEYPLFVVADGLGGHKAGEVASATAIETFASQLLETLKTTDNPQDLLNQMKLAVYAADKVIISKSRENEDLKGMGTTITAGCFTNSKLAFVHIGDSRLYLFRDGELKKLTTDHTYVQYLVDIGEISEEEAANHPMRSALTQALGGEMSIEADGAVISVKPGDIFLFCSDGLYSMVNGKEIKAVLQSEESLQEKADELVEKALNAGGLDNITLILVQVENNEN